MADVDTRALGHLRNAKRQLTRQQFQTLRGQILAGDPDGAMKGLQRLLQQRRGQTNGSAV